MIEVTHSHLPKLVTNLQQLQLSIAWWARCYAEAGLQSEAAWQMHDNAIDNGNPAALVEDLRETARMFDQIRCTAWREWESAKQALLALSN